MGFPTGFTSVFFDALFETDQTGFLPPGNSTRHFTFSTLPPPFVLLCFKFYGYVPYQTICNQSVRVINDSHECHDLHCSRIPTHRMVRTADQLLALEDQHHGMGLPLIHSRMEASMTICLEIRYERIPSGNSVIR
jgi:hypothetical protein